MTYVLWAWGFITGLCLCCAIYNLGRISGLQEARRIFRGEE